MAENTLENQVRSILKDYALREKHLRKGVMRGAAYVAGEIATFLEAGTLARSFRAEFLVSNKHEVSAHAVSRGAAEMYARIQDEGGIIRPRVRQFLAVPIKTAGIAKGKWPRHFGMGELKLIPRPGRPSLLVKELKGSRVLAKSSRGSVRKTWVKAIQPMFVLVRQTAIKPKHYLAKVTEITTDRVTEILLEAWEEGAK